MKDTTIPPKMRLGTDEFKKLFLYSDVFVDKSLLIKALLEDSGEVILITRPRRWGKTLNMSMVRRFLEIEIDAQGNPLPLEERQNIKLFTGGTIDVGFDETKELQPLKIATHTNILKRLGQFPVLSITFKSVTGSSYEAIEAGIKTQFRNLFQANRYLMHSIQLAPDEKDDFALYLSNKITKEQIKNSLSLLTKLLKKHYNRQVWVLIDEYDTPINSAYRHFGENETAFQEVLELFRGMMQPTFKQETGDKRLLQNSHKRHRARRRGAENRSILPVCEDLSTEATSLSGCFGLFCNGLEPELPVERGMITGILRIAKAELFSGLNNVREYSLLDKSFASAYGFTQEEVDELLTKVPTDTDPQKIKDWYNGYTFGGEIIYNPWSIMQCLAHKGKLDHYWIDSGGTAFIDKVFVSDAIQGDIQDLLEGKEIIKKLYKQIALGDIGSNKDIFFSLLLFAGYLSPYLSNDNEEDPVYRLTIPNKEVRGIYVSRVIRWVTEKLNMDPGDYLSFIALLIDQHIDQFAAKFQDYLLHSTSYHDLSREKDYHNLMGGLLAPLVSSYTITSNQETGLGRCDHILIPIAGRGDDAIIIEYKIVKDKKELAPNIAKQAEYLASVAQLGLQQIIDKQYHVKVKPYTYVKQIISLSMAFCGKQVEIAYQVTAMEPTGPNLTLNRR